MLAGTVAQRRPVRVDRQPFILALDRSPDPHCRSTKAGPGGPATLVRVCAHPLFSLLAQRRPVRVDRQPHQDQLRYALALVAQRRPVRVDRQPPAVQRVAYAPQGALNEGRSGWTGNPAGCESSRSVIHFAQRRPVRVDRQPPETGSVSSRHGCTAQRRPVRVDRQPRIVTQR